VGVKENREKTLTLIQLNIQQLLTILDLKLTWIFTYFPDNFDLFGLFLLLFSGFLPRKHS